MKRSYCPASLYADRRHPPLQRIPSEAPTSKNPPLPVGSRDSNVRATLLPKQCRMATRSAPPRMAKTLLVN